ncbi:hypothetical protein [Paenibacillus sp. NPDC093718]|uniref:hypothetical protein n=1 Tax=Paenibacillus sp. NPDC093718 TaxID=3390601 RepID=UPI003CFE76E1
METAKNTQVSSANLLIVFLIFVGSVLPSGLFRRVMNLGATRKEYYIGMLLVYSIWSVTHNADNLSILFASSRILHMIAVVAALIFMFRPATNRYFKAEL